MAVFHIPLLCSRTIYFYKLLGSGKAGSFSKVPDLMQWAVFFTGSKESSGRLPAFMQQWVKIFKCEVLCFTLQPLQSKGSWDGNTLFETFEPPVDENKPIAILTRATIRLSRLKEFWQNVPPVSAKLHQAKGLILSVGIGEIPLVKQATFSVWQSLDDMKAFAYSQKEHAEVIQKTRQRNWYSEELFTRFKITGCTGTLNGKNPLRDYDLNL